MAITMHAASVGVFDQLLKALEGVLAKGEAWAEHRKIDPAVLLAARLAPDMFALTRQVQIATDMTKGCAARLAGVEAPKYEDTEASFGQLRARITNTAQFIDSLSIVDIDASTDKPITITVQKNDLHFTGQSYLLHWAMPNIIFHCTAAYAILRHNGVDVGKRDFLGRQ